MVGAATTAWLISDTDTTASIIPRTSSRGRAHINGIEGFWGLAKVRLAKFKGLPKQTFHLHLKETEWRYNHRSADKPKLLLSYLRENPLS
jgi:transposase